MGLFDSMKPTVTLRAYCVVPYLAKKHEQTKESPTFNKALYALKDGGFFEAKGKKTPAADVFAEAVHESVAKWVKPDTVWLPLPGSSESPADRADEKTVRFANAVAKRFGGTVCLGLVRSGVVAASHLGPAEQRTSVEGHRASMSLRSAPARGASLILVDDVLTRGNTAVGATLALQDHGFTVTQLVAAAYSRFPDDAEDQDAFFKVVWHSPNLNARKSRTSQS